MKKVDNIRKEEAMRIKCRMLQFESFLKSETLQDETFAGELMKTVNQFMCEYESLNSIPNYDEEIDYRISRSFSFRENPRERDGVFENENISIINERFKSRFLPNHFYFDDLRSDEELIRDLGILYLMFGSTYCTYLNYHTYKLRLKKKFRLEEAFARAEVDLYEDDVLIFNNFVIGFWPYHPWDNFVGDMEWACYTSDVFEKYDNGCSDYLNKILKEMGLIRNSYLGDSGVIPARLKCLAGYINDDAVVEIERLHSTSEIQRVEMLIDSGSYYMSKNVENYRISSRREYRSLHDFLKKSGVVYQVRKGGIYIWECNKNRFQKLVGYSPYRNKFGGEYILYLMPEEAL